MANVKSDLHSYLERWRAGDSSARDELLGQCQDRLRLLARRMLRQYPRVRRWEETDDVFQNALIRLDRALANNDVKAQLESPEALLRLGATMIRRELIDLARHYYGPHGAAVNLLTPSPGPASTPAQAEPAASSSSDPERLINWSELHGQIEALPDEDRQIFDLLWYQGLTQQETAELLGLPLRTLKRRWQEAKLRLIDHFGGDSPF